MKNRILPLLFFLFLYNSSNAQFDTAFAKANIQHCADSLVHGFKTRNWELFTRYSYPALVGTLGGKDAFINYISGVFGGIPDSAWKKYETGKILQVIKTAGDMQAVIELHSVIEWENTRISSTNHLVAESWDGGLFWTFFDSQNDRVATRLIKPDLSDLLIIPKKVEKVEPIDSGSKKKINKVK